LAFLSKSFLPQGVQVYYYKNNLNVKQNFRNFFAFYRDGISQKLDLLNRWKYLMKDMKKTGVDIQIKE